MQETFHCTKGNCEVIPEKLWKIFGKLRRSVEVILGRIFKKMCTWEKFWNHWRKIDEFLRKILQKFE